MILSARDLKVRGVLCALRFVHVVDFSMSHGGRVECGAWVAVVSDAYRRTGVWDGVDLASPPIKHKLNIGNLYLSWPKLFNTFSHILT